MRVGAAAETVAVLEHVALLGLPVPYLGAEALNVAFPDPRPSPEPP